MQVGDTVFVEGYTLDGARSHPHVTACEVTALDAGVATVREVRVLRSGVKDWLSIPKEAAREQKIPVSYFDTTIENRLQQHQKELQLLLDACLPKT